MNLLTLAGRNVYRNRQRSLVTTIAMAFACAMMIVFSGLMVGLLKGSEYNIVAMNTGDIEIHQPGYRQDPDIYKLIPDAANLSKQLRAAGFAVTTRLYTSGLMASNASSSGVRLTGIDLEHESQVSELAKHLLKGRWLQADKPHDVVIGRKLARLLDVGVGDELVFVGQTADGFMANDKFTVGGILKSVSATIDNAGVMMTQPMLRALISLPPGVHELVLMRHNRDEDLNQAKARVQQIVGPKLEVVSWRDLMPIISRFLDTADIQTMIMQLFTYIAVGSVVLNAVLMSVFERIKQFGIMKAIGVRPWQLVRLIYLESLMQALIAAVLGGAAGSAFILYLQHHGIDLSSLADGFSFAGIALDPIWYASVTLPVIAIPIMFLFVMTLIAVIYPAAKAARLKPVEAINHR